MSLALARSTTRYTVYLGNDTFPHAGWLEAMLAAEPFPDARRDHGT